MGFEAIAKTGANTVRIVCADGDLYDKTSQQEYQQIVDWCKQNRLDCVNVSAQNDSLIVYLVCCINIEDKTVVSGQKSETAFCLQNSAYILKSKLTRKATCFYLNGTDIFLNGLILSINGMINLR